MYVTRKHGDISLRELAAFLGLKEWSTISHGVKRAEQRLKQDRSFNRKAKAVMTAEVGH